MRSYVVILFLVVLLTTACGSSAGEVAAAVAETRAAEPSPTAVMVTVMHTSVAEVPVTIEVTRQVEVMRDVEVTRNVEVTRDVEVTRIVEIPVTVTYTPTPTPTEGPSPTPTNTSTPTITPSPTPSNTPTATNTPTPTNTPTITPTNTPIPTNTPTFEEALGDEFEEITDVRELEIRGDDYLGESIRIRGQIFNIMQDGVQIWVQSPGGRVAVAVAMEPSELPVGIYENSYITVYGLGGGTMEGENAYGGTISQPLIFGVHVMP